MSRFAESGGAMHTREELIGYIDLFLDAIGHNDPSRLPVSPNARYTENCQDLPLGKGLWRTATPFKPAEHFIDVADPESGQVGYLGLVHENNQPSAISVRLRVSDGLVSEIEVLVARRPEDSGHPRVFNPENMVTPNPTFSALVTPELRTSREDLIHVANLYLDGILAADGQMIPVLDDCIRVENGTQTVLNPDRGTETGRLGVAAQVSTGVFRDIEAARERRPAIIDVERGLAFVIFLFDHPGPVTGAPFPSRYSQPNSMMVAELFKIVDGTIHQIEAVLNVFPYGTKSGWT
jgi:hypothetical protein